MDLFGKKRIAELEKANSNLNRRLQEWEDSAFSSLKKHTNQLALTNRALGRIIAKLDPMYGASEHDPVRKANSDAIGDEVIKRLQGEIEASTKGVY